jgi:hypothetical protein
MLGESTGPVDIVPSHTPLGSNRKCMEQGVTAQRAGCSSAVCLAVRYEANLVGRHARPPSRRLLSQRNKSNVHSSANAGVEGSFEMPGGGDGVTRGARSGRQGGSQQQGNDCHIVCHAYTVVSNRNVDISRTGQAADEVERLELGPVLARPESRVNNHLEVFMASVQRITAMTLGGVISVHKTRVLGILRSPEFPANRAYLLLIVVSDSKAVSSGLSELGWLEL